MILAIDRGSKMCGLAKVHADLRIPLPVGNCPNDGNLLPTLCHIIAQESITIVVIGIPNNKKITEKVKKLGSQIQQSCPEIAIAYIDEDFSTVMTYAQIDNYAKGHHTDTMSAMEIARRYIESVV